MEEKITRALDFNLTLTPETKRLQSDYYVEGHAATFDRYPLFVTRDGTIVYEQWDRNCFAESDISDVVMQYDHTGTVIARTTNGTLGLDVDERGLFMYADLGKTHRAREIYEEVSVGMTTKMSIRCTVDNYFDDATNTVIISKVNKIYDVSAVSIPANNYTDIETRSLELVDVDKIEARINARKLKLRLKLETL